MAENKSIGETIKEACKALKVMEKIDEKFKDNHGHHDVKDAGVIILSNIKKSH